MPTKLTITLFLLAGTLLASSTPLMDNFDEDSERRILAPTKSTDSGKPKKPDGKPEGCKYVERYGGSITSDIIKNEYGFCKAKRMKGRIYEGGLAWTCCTKQSFTSMTKWWMLPADGNKDSEFKMVSQEQELFGGVIRAILGQSLKIEERAFSLYKKCMSIKNAGECRMISSVVKYSLKLTSLESFKKIWQTAARTCWNYLAEVRSSIFCAVCSPKFGEMVKSDGTNTYLKIHYKESRAFIDNCFDYIYSDSNLMSLLSQISLLFSFDTQGNKIPGKKVITIPQDAKRSSELDICLRNKENPQCIVLLTEEFSFRGLTKFNLKNLKTVVDIKKELFKDLKIADKKRLLPEAEKTSTHDPKGNFEDFKLLIGKSFDKEDGIKLTIQYLEGASEALRRLSPDKAINFSALPTLFMLIIFSIFFY